MRQLNCHILAKNSIEFPDRHSRGGYMAHKRLTLLLLVLGVVLGGRAAWAHHSSLARIRPGHAGEGDRHAQNGGVAEPARLVLRRRDRG